MSEGTESAGGGERARPARREARREPPVTMTGEPLEPAGEQERASRSDMEPLFRGPGDRRPAA